jgi:hypothetical protein
MIINLSPQRRDDALEVSKAGDVLTINGAVFDFSSLPDGASIPHGIVPCEFIAGSVERIDGKLSLTLLLPHGANAPQVMRFPGSITDPPDGDVALPTVAAPQPITPPNLQDEKHVDT